MKKILFTILLISSVSFAQSAGNTGLAFLKFGYGARNIAMGDAGSSASNDLSALYYNPSRLVSFEDNQAMFMHSEWIQDVTSEVGGIKWNMFNLPWAVGFNVTSVADIEVRERPGEAISSFNANYFFLSLSSGFKVIKDLDFGATVKYIYEGILNDQSVGYGLDFGLNYFTPVKGLTASTVIRNIGSMNALNVVGTTLPLDFRLGGAYNFNVQPSKLDFILTGEFQKYLDNDDIHFNTGAEAVYNETFAARVGYQTGYEARGFTAGIGIEWGSLRFDYAYTPFSLGLGNANQFSLQFSF
jgi:hypothetical protein